MIKTSLEKDLNKVKKEYPSLSFKPDIEAPKEIGGLLPVIDTNGINWGTFEIKITVPTKYPNDFPKMFELGQRIPKIPNRHINPDGSCCVCILQQMTIESRRGISILSYLKKYAIPFFANQLYFEREGSFYNGEYSHGEDGIVQFYLENFSGETITQVIFHLRQNLQKKLPKRNQTCYCGSGKKFKQCHLSHHELLTLIGQSQIKNDLQLLKSIL